MPDSIQMEDTGHQEAGKIVEDMGSSAGSCSGSWHSGHASHNQIGGVQVGEGSAATETLLLQIRSELKAFKLSQEKANRWAEAQLSLINSNMQQMSTRVKEVKHWVSDLENGGSHMEASILRYQAELTDLQIQVDDAENRSHRSNLRFTGITEGRETGGY
ncbi:hypothetical protein NDU88_004318 [Pleurodeles waltl]|uniref:Uncharacterized protein n=1 Tax=Pleurodeles waltl TaxID=8319 RepID=A0AAV7RHS7_PLEWA|nr:hypothetical protein NDU88_004318 [Pleurodeles waltl]